MTTTNDTLIFEAVVLTADKDKRTFRAPLLPFGESGRTNLGALTASRGRLKLPKDPASIVGRLGHDDPDQPAASQAVQLVETDEGLMLAGKILESDEGDRLAVEIEAGERNMVSVEVARPIIRDGQLIGGTLYAYAHVAEGAFPSARLVAKDHGDADLQELVDRLTAENVKYRKRAQAAEGELAQLKGSVPPVLDRLAAELELASAKP